MKKLLFFLLYPLAAIKAQDAQLEKYCDSLMPNAGHTDMPASLLIVAKDGKPLVRKAYGMANLEMGVPASADHLFTLASVNKQMIAVCVLQLAQKGKLKLADDIRKYLPGFNTHGQVVTVEQLLNHTSGIYSANSPRRGKSFYEQSTGTGIMSDKEFLDYAGETPLLFEPGTDWSWNTWAYHIALFIIEKASGMPFNEYVRNYLFQPAGMSRSFSKVDGNRLGLYGIRDLNTSFYFPDADGKWVWRDTRGFTPYFLYQRYSIVTCLDDLVKWDVALREEKVLPKEWINKAWTAGQLRDGRITNYGLGWVVSEQDKYQIFSHIGIGTNPICVVHVPSEKLYIAYTQFFGTIEQAESKVKKILSRLLPLSYPTVDRGTAKLSDYTGVYQVHRNGLDIAAQISDVPVYINVTAGNDTLFLQQTAGEKIMLRPAGNDRFLPAASENTYYVFVRDKDGQVNGITTQGSFWTYGPEVRNKRVHKAWPLPVSGKKVAAALLNKYVGIYHLSSTDSYIVIETDGSKLYNRVQGRLQELIPVADNIFVRKGAEDIRFEFKNTADEAIHLVFSGLRSAMYKKLD